MLESVLVDVDVGDSVAVVVGVRVEDADDEGEELIDGVSELLGVWVLLRDWLVVWDWLGVIVPLSVCVGVRDDEGVVLCVRVTDCVDDNERVEVWVWLGVRELVRVGVCVRLGVGAWVTLGVIEGDGDWL